MSAEQCPTCGVWWGGWPGAEHTCRPGYTTTTTAGGMLGKMLGKMVDPYRSRPKHRSDRPADACSQIILVGERVTGGPCNQCADYPPRHRAEVAS